MPFKIQVAETAGFCFGVRKALDKLLEIRNNTDEPVRTLGPLIHNDQVLMALKKRKVQQLTDNEEVTGKHVVLRAHGVTPKTRNNLKARHAKVCDATCPKVGQVQAIVKKYTGKGCPVIIVGDKGHAEVDGLLGYSRDLGIVIPGPDEAKHLKGGEEVCVVAQTTQDQNVFVDTVKIIREKYAQCHEFNTICDATSERQQETRGLARKSDLMIVVGGSHSANTQRLSDIAAEHCRTVMIQTQDDIREEMFHGVHKVGITAGASTPAWVIRDVVNTVHKTGWKQSGILSASLFSLVSILVETNLSWAGGMALLSLSLNRLVTGQYYGWIAATLFLLIWVWRSHGKRLSPGLDFGVISAFTTLASLPVLINDGIPSVVRLSVLGYLTATILIRLLFHDCLHVQADRIAGLQTLPVVSCEGMVMRLVLVASGSMLVLASILAITLKQVPVLSLLLAPVMELVCLMYLFRKPHWLTLKASILFESPIWLTIGLVGLLLAI